MLHLFAITSHNSKSQGKAIGKVLPLDILGITLHLPIYFCLTLYSIPPS